VATAATVRAGWSPDGVCAADAAPARLLIVEDDLDVLALLEGFLADFGFLLRNARSGSEGLAQCRQEPPDLLLLDIGIPPPDGFAVLRELKADRWLWRIPVLLITGRDDAESKAEAFRHGAHDYLTKPVEETELRARITRHLDMARFTQGLMQRLAAYQSRFGSLDDQALQPRCGGGDAGQVERLRRARDLIETHLAEPLSAAALADAVGLSQRALARGFSALFGTSIHAHLREARLQRARRLLRCTDLLVKTIALEVGYRQTSDLTRAMVARFGASPTALRQEARGGAADPCR
jgi:DNA-binding response OmpR family regulator